MGSVKAAKSSNDVHIYSTLANPQMFTTYRAGGADLPVIDVQVLVRGGTGIASKNLITPNGVHTAISQAEYDAIKDLEHFKFFVKNDSIRVQAKKVIDIDSVATDMNPRDPGGPLTPADFAAVPQDGSAPLPVDEAKVGSGWVNPSR